MKQEKKEPETTFAGLMEAVTEGQVSAEELLQEMEAHPEWLTENPADMAFSKFRRMAKSGRMPMGNNPNDEDVEDDMAAAAAAGCPAPGSKIGSRGRGRGLARGRGRGPMGMGRGPSGMPPREKQESTSEDTPPVVVTDTVLALSGTTFESLVAEKCGMMHKDKKKKSKQKESIHEFAAPERQDVIYWARGRAPKRTEPKNPFYFQEDQMFSRKQLIAQRSLEEKTAQVVHPNRLDAISGRHAVLAQKGLRYAGYKVEFVNEL